MTLALLARRLQRATDLQSIADVVIECLLARPDIRGVALIGHRKNAPVIWIGDADPAWVRAFLGGAYARDADFCHVLATHTPRFVEPDCWVLPILGAGPLFGTLRVIVVDRHHPSSSELVLAAAQVSIRIARLGIEVASATPPLSARQREIAWLVARGCTNSEIANMLGYYFPVRFFALYPVFMLLLYGVCCDCIWSDLNHQGGAPKKVASTTALTIGFPLLWLMVDEPRDPHSREAWCAAPRSRTRTGTTTGCLN